MSRVCYKVLRCDLTSLGLLGAPVMRYRCDTWNGPAEPLSRHPRKGGGLWVAPRLGDARAMQRYMRRKHGVATRVFRCRVGRVLHETSCRVKVSRLRFGAADEVFP